MIRAYVIIDHARWKNKIKSPKDYIQKKIKKLSKFHLFKNKNQEFTILLTNNKKMKKLNKKFRKKNKSTDVLSFPSTSSYGLKYIRKKNFYLGDIAVSYEIVNSRSKKNNFFYEFDKVWVHGFLHLVGYDHIKNKDYFKMDKIEKRILNLI